MRPFSHPYSRPFNEWAFDSLAEGVAFYEAQGFRQFDSDGAWVTLRNGDAEAYVRADRGSEKPFCGSVVRLL